MPPPGDACFLVEQPGDLVSSLPDGASILHNVWLTALELPDSSGLELYLQQVQNQQERRVEQEACVAGSYVPPTITLPPASRGSSAAVLAWTLACCQIDGTVYYSLTSSPTTTTSMTPDHRGQSSEEGLGNAPSHVYHGLLCARGLRDRALFRFLYQKIKISFMPHTRRHSLTLLSQCRADIRFPKSYVLHGVC
jgi:hypothetical protein